MTENCSYCHEDLAYHDDRNLKCRGRETSYLSPERAAENALSADLPQCGEHEALKSFDAQVWAREFIKVVSQKPEIATDEGTMIAWFSNALMRGYDEHYWRSESYKREVRRVLVPWWKRLFDSLTLAL